MYEPLSTVPRQVRASAAAYGDAEAISDAGTSLSFIDVADSALTIARALAAQGVAKGDRVAIWAPNSHHVVQMVLGIQTAGAVVVPINTRYRAEEARELIERTAAKVVLVHSGFLDFDYRSAILTLPIDEHHGVYSVESVLAVVDLGVSPTEAPGGKAEVLRWTDFIGLAHGVSVEQALTTAESIGPDDLAEILFTSGTTGKSKGVEVAHGALVDLYRTFGEIWGVRAGDRYLVSLPMFHAGGLNAGVLTSLIHGLTIVPMAVFDTVETMKLIEQERISVMNGPPTVIYSILDHPARPSYDLSSLRTMATGAAVVPVAMVERAQTELPFEHFITAYGMTECYGTATMCRRDDSNQTIANTNGRALPGIALRAVDSDGQDVPVGQAGEILIRGANVTPGYWQAEDLTAATIVDGWLHTGDIGTVDSDGYLKITDRLKDLFVVGGFNVSPAEVEQLLARHPAVGEVSVIGVPDDRLGEVARAYIICKTGAEATEEEIIAWCRERIANFKVPRSVVFAENLPRNASGKVLKTQLREPVDQVGTTP